MEIAIGFGRHEICFFVSFIYFWIIYQDRFQCNNNFLLILQKRDPMPRYRWAYLNFYLTISLFNCMDFWISVVGRTDGLKICFLLHNSIRLFMF